MFQLVVLVALVTVTYGNEVNEQDVRFYLSNTKYSYEQIRTGAGILDINPEKEIKIICHGWVDSIDSYWYPDTKLEYTKRGMTNVIGVDWSAHANGLYSTAVRRTQPVGEHIARLVLYIHQTYGVPLSNFHLIGHSLGAHISGFAGKYIKATTGQSIGRITGLDPAGPSWEGNPADQRLATGDADFVDVMHTDGGGLGIRASIGDVDYFPNGGTSRQNGCGLLEIACSHNRAPRYFFESINSRNFIAAACQSVSDFNSGRCANNQVLVMGENVDQSARGDFYLNTNREAPFGMGRL